MRKKNLDLILKRIKNLSCFIRLDMIDFFLCVKKYFISKNYFVIVIDYDIILWLHFCVAAENKNIYDFIFMIKYIG